MFASGKTAAVASAANYIEDVFSTYLYTGNASTQTITNGIDLSTKGGLVWLKTRNQAYSNTLYDTARGVNKLLFSDNTDAQFSSSGYLTNFGSTGFTVGANENTNFSTSNTAVSWTFRKQPKFFDVVTYTGNGSGTRAISHSLASVPGCVILKRTDTTGNWQVYHQNLTTPNASAASNALLLNDTVAGQNTTAWGSTAPTSTQFTVGSSQNTNGATYVVYLFAHDAGGFGLTGTDNVISCGSFNVDGSGNATVDLGYEPQWVMIKTYETTANWAVFDNMRGMPVGNTNVARLFPNTSGAESSSTDYNVSPTATGFTALATGYAGSAYDGFIYIAIRRGPMKVPTSGTSVFSPQTATGYQSPNIVTDSVMFGVRGGASYSPALYSRLQGSTPYLITSSTDAEATGGSIGFDSSNGINYSVPSSWITYYFKRAPSFFDEVCYTGTGSATTVTHNLGVAPELIIVKSRSIAAGWPTYSATLGATKYLVLQGTQAEITGSTIWNDTAPTSSVFTLGTAAAVNGSGTTYVAYLFATCAGVSKVGSYTGTGTTKQIDCGFTGGARFVLIKRTDSTGDWYVWDTARGIVSGNDPYLLLNSTAAETTGTDYIDTYSAGFEISSTAPAAINASGGTFIFLAIA